MAGRLLRIPSAAARARQLDRQADRLEKEALRLRREAERLRAAHRNLPTGGESA